MILPTTFTAEPERVTVPISHTGTFEHATNVVLTGTLDSTGGSARTFWIERPSPFSGYAVSRFLVARLAQPPQASEPELTTEVEVEDLADEPLPEMWATLYAAGAEEDRMVAECGVGEYREGLDREDR